MKKESTIEFEKIAAECIAELSDIEFIKLNIGYVKHHFNYGLYLRNKYILPVCTSHGLSADDLSDTLYTYIVAGLFPQLGIDIDKIHRLINDLGFSEICTHYYLRKGVMPFEDFPIENYEYVQFSHTYDEGEFRKMYKVWCSKDKENMNKYVLPIAESVWNYDVVKADAVTKGIPPEFIDEAYEWCREKLVKKSVFLPLEIIYYSQENCSDSSTDKILRKHLEFFFLNHRNEEIPEYLYKNRDFVKIAVSCHGSALESADKFNNDFEIVRAAVEDTPYAIQYASDELKSNMEIVELAASKSEYCLLFSLPCMEKYNDDDRLVKMAIEANGANIAYASERIRDNYEMAEFALRNQKDFYPECAFSSLSPRLRNDKALALLELETSHTCVWDFSDELKDDDEIAMRIMERDDVRFLMNYMSERIQKMYKQKLC